MSTNIQKEQEEKQREKKKERQNVKRDCRQTKTLIKNTKNRIHAFRERQTTHIK